MNTGYTHRINLHRKVAGRGWMFQSYPTTKAEYRNQIRVLYKEQTAGKVRNIELVLL